jgi:ABC-2 type transport system permease protein
MIWRRVMALEWRIMKRDPSLIWVLSIFAIFLILSSLAGGDHADSLEDGLSRSQEEVDNRFQGLQNQLSNLKPDSPLRSKDPRDPVWMGQDGGAQLAILPPGPLAPIAIGERDLHPQAIRITTDLNLTAEGETETPMVAPSRLRTGALDPTFLFVVLFPLVVIALSYELLSGERERGTLAMLLSQPVSQSELVVGKALARAGALSMVTLLFAGIGLAVAGVSWADPGTLSHFLLYGLILICWALFWFAAAVLVNAWSPSSARNALTLVGIWLSLVVIIPGLVQVGIDTFYPAPSAIDLMHEARESSQDVESKLNDMEGRHDVDPKQAGYAAKVVQVQDELAARAKPVLETLRRQVKERREVIQMLQYTSPAIVVQLALEDVAGSGAIRHQRFEEQSDTYHEAFRSFFVSRIKEEKTLGTEDLDMIPKMTFQEEPFGALSGRVLTGIAYLFMSALALLMLALPGLGKIGRLTR